MGSVDEHGRFDPPPEIYASALRFFDRHTAPGRPGALSAELERERGSFVFRTNGVHRSARRTRSFIEEITDTSPSSLEVPLTRPLEDGRCYGEVYLDLSEDGRYIVIVEKGTFSSLFMYRLGYRP